MQRIQLHVCLLKIRALAYNFIKYLLLANVKMLLIYFLSLKLFSNANYLHICMKHQRRHSIISKMYFSLKICIRKLEENNHLSLRGVWGTSMEDATQA